MDDKRTDKVSTAPEDVERLAKCPFCGKPLKLRVRSVNPYGRCGTQGCYGAKMPVVNLDVPEDIAAWNTRALSSEVERLKVVLFKSGAWMTAPCCLCGYNGPRYFQPDTHKCAALGE